MRLPQRELPYAAGSIGVVVLPVLIAMIWGHAAAPPAGAPAAGVPPVTPRSPQHPEHAKAAARCPHCGGVAQPSPEGGNPDARLARP